MIRGISHLGIAVTDLDEAVEHYRKLFGVAPDGVEELPEQGVRLCIFRLANAEVELIEPLGSRGDSLRRFLEKRGDGIHHVCLEVEDVQAEVDRLHGEGFTPVGPPREGALGRRVAFLRPSRGVLIELVEPVGG